MEWGEEGKTTGKSGTPRNAGPLSSAAGMPPIADVRLTTAVRGETYEPSDVRGMKGGARVAGDACRPTPSPL